MKSQKEIEKEKEKAKALNYKAKRTIEESKEELEEARRLFR